MRVRKVWLKVFRDVTRSGWQFFAAGVVIALGVAIFIGSYGSYQNLRSSYDRTYEELKMGDLWFHADGTPASTVDAVRSTDGVEAAEGRLIVDLPAVLPAKGPDRLLVRFVSLPSDASARPAVNNVKVTGGSYVSGPDQVLLERSFADFNHVHTGDALQVILPDGTTKQLTVAGTAASPEYLWVAKSEQDVLVPPDIFGVAFIPYDGLAPALGEDGTVNDVAVRLAPGADQQAVTASVSQLIAPDGAVKVTDRANQISNRLLHLDLDGFRSLALVFPLLFLAVSSLAIYSLLSRLVQSQRGQIGVLRAMGYTRRQVLVSYAGFGVLIGAVGAALGVVGGFALSVFITWVYAYSLHVPFVSFGANLGLLAVAFAAGFLAALLAAAIPAWASSGIRPAEAMRPPVPAAGRRTLLEIVAPPVKRLPYVLKLPLRSVFRVPRRTLYTAFGVAAGVTLTLVAASFLDSYNAAVHYQFDRIQAYDARLNFSETFPVGLAQQAVGVDGVSSAEPIVEAPVEVSANGKAQDTLVRGLPSDGQLLRVYTTDGAQVAPGDGIMLTPPVADKLGVKPGDDVTVRPLAGSGQARTLTVDEIVRQPLGDVAFSRLDTAQRLLGAPGMGTALLLGFNGSHLSADERAQLTGLPGAANLELTSDLRSYVKTLSQLFLVFVGVMLAFGVALGFTVTFNTITINVLERERELATMRTFGMSVGRLASMISIENLLMGLLGAALGMPIGYGVAAYFSTLYQNDLFDMPLVINTTTYALAGLAAVIVLLLAEVPSIRHVRNLDLPAVVREMSA